MVKSTSACWTDEIAGVNFEFYASRAPEAQFVGLDPNPEMRQYSELAASTANLKNFEFVTGYADSMPFDDASFDFVVSTLVRSPPACKF